MGKSDISAGPRPEESRQTHPNPTTYRIDFIDLMIEVRVDIEPALVTMPDVSGKWTTQISALLDVVKSVIKVKLTLRMVCIRLTW
jgi:hypothetical protein